MGNRVISKCWGYGGEVRALASHKCGPGLIRPRVIFGLSLLLVFALLRVVFPDSLVFHLPKKKTCLSSNLTRIQDTHEHQLRLMWLPV